MFIIKTISNNDNIKKYNKHGSREEETIHYDRTSEIVFPIIEVSRPVSF